MFKKLLALIYSIDSAQGKNAPAQASLKSSKLMRHGHAMRVIFFYPGEEGTYIDHAEVSLYENGTVHIQSKLEETTTHLKNCEILWRYEENEGEDRVSKVRLIKPKLTPNDKDPGVFP